MWIRLQSIVKISHKSHRISSVLNSILNGLQHSIHNIVQGNTITANRHPEKMDYIVSEPLSSWTFQSGVTKWRPCQKPVSVSLQVPKVPAKSKDKMAIMSSLSSIIIYSLKPDGQAAVVLPTGFITAQSGIDKNIRQHLVDNQMLAGVVSMPSNIFATTGTKCLHPFLLIRKTRVMSSSSMPQILEPRSRKARTKRPCYLLRKSRRLLRPLSRKKPSRTFLSPVSYEDIKEKNYSLSAGQYFDIKIDYVDITAEEFEAKMTAFQDKLSDLFQQSHALEQEIEEQIRRDQV